MTLEVEKLLDISLHLMFHVVLLLEGVSFSSPLPFDHFTFPRWFTKCSMARVFWATASETLVILIPYLEVYDEHIFARFWI